MPTTCPASGSAADFLPKRRPFTLPQLAKAAARCQGCPLYCHATHVVFGEGPKAAKLILIGEQPGDQEDRAGKPFVGPSGHLLDEALEAAKISRDHTYVTNAVKHFKWTPSPNGKRRIHSKPAWSEINACRPWLDAELAVLKPTLILTLGATAAQALLGKSFRLTQHRGEVQNFARAPVLATLHPSALLRMPDKTARDAAQESFFQDFRHAAKLLQ